MPARLLRQATIVWTIMIVVVPSLFLIYAVASITQQQRDNAANHEASRVDRARLHAEIADNIKRIDALRDELIEIKEHVHMLESSLERIHPREARPGDRP